MNISKSFIFVLLSLLSFTCLADNKNQFNYFGINALHNSYENIDFTPGIDMSKIPSLKYNETISEIGYRGFVGHQFNRYIAVEAGMTSFGKASFTVTEDTIDTNDKTTTSILHNGEFKTLSGDIRTIATYPINDSLYLKAQVGILAWDNEVSFLTKTDGELTTEKHSDNGVSLITGLGIAYGFNKLVAIAIDFETTEIANIDTKNMGLSLLVRF